MSKFLTALDVSLIDDAANEYRGLWRLDAPLVYQSDVARQTITAPAGMITDFESCPRLPVVFFLVGEVTREAAVIHDYLYKSKMLPRALADKVLLEACAVTGIPAWRRWLIYAGVRVGGASHFGT
jgi:hypothetical protein